MKNNAIVTGSEGFIGGYLVRYLARAGWRVTGTYRSKSNGTGKDGIEYVQCDLRNGQRFERILKTVQPTHVFHLGAQSLPTSSWEDPLETFESNIIGSLNLFEAVRNIDNRPVVVSACSSAEYGHVPPSAIPVTEEQPLNPLHPYGISKACLDMLSTQYFLNYGVPSINIRLFNTTGPGKTNDAPSDFVRQVARISKGQQSPEVRVGNLESKRSFLGVNDTVKGFVLAAERGRPGQVYNLCAKQLHTMREILDIAIEVAGIKAVVVQDPGLMRPSDEAVIYGNSDKLVRDTGWVPDQNLRQIVESMFAYWCEKDGVTS